MNLLFGLLMLFQSVKMTEDFLPLAKGNHWVYDVSNEAGQKTGQMDFAITDRTIISGRSVYAVSGYPFAGESSGVRTIGYDREGRQFVRVSGDLESPLFPGDTESTKVLQSDSSGIPQKFELSTGTTTLVFQRGVGIVEARLNTPDGIRIAKIANTNVGKPAATGPTAITSGTPIVASAASAPASAPLPPVRTAVTNVAPVTAENPVLILNTEPDPAGIKLTLFVSNTSDKLLPFKFNSSKTYDFIITDPATGMEIWRLSRGMMYAQVIRSDSIRANSKWTYSEVWKKRDNDGNPVAPGKYQLIGILSSQPEIKSDPVTIEVQ